MPKKNSNKYNKNLFVAILAIYSGINNPRSSDWFIFETKRNFLVSKIRNSYKEIFGVSCAENDEQLLKVWDIFGKNKLKNIKRIATNIKGST